MKEVHDVTGRQARGSQPVEVRSGEMPGSAADASESLTQSPTNRRRVHYAHLHGTGRIATHSDTG